MSYLKSTSIASLVVPATLLTITLSSFNKAFTKLLFPTFGLPITHILVISVSSFSFGLKSITISNRVTSIGDIAFSGDTNLTIYCEQGSYAETYAKANNISIVYSDVKDIVTKAELERLEYYGDSNIIPSDESYFTVNETGETITGLTDEGKTQT